MDLTAFVTSFDGVAFEKLADGRFVAQTGIPTWCRAIRPGVRWDAPLVIADVFPFMTVFLPEAERAWRSEERARAESDFWAESDAKGGDVHLLAAAVRVGEARALLVLRNERLFLRNQSLLQRARELRMVHASLMREIEQKDILVHAIVHDLAAPLHSIIGALSLLSEQTQPSPDGRWVRLALDAAYRQRELIGEILDVFTAEGGAPVAVGSEGVDLCAVLERVVAEREPVAQTRRIRIVKELGSFAAAAVGDETRLFRVLTNLLDNALRYSPEGGAVRVKAGCDGASCTVFVEDEGPGVAAELLPTLFEKFARGRDRASGSGLGLFFCRITVENWGGGIGYEPREPRGARFWIRLASTRMARPRPVGPTKGEKGDGEAPHAR
jgi:signal transduction histidine kinase